MKKILTVWLVISVLFLTSCIKMDSSLVINNDLTMDWVTTFDYTQMNATSWSFSSSFTFWWSWSVETENSEKKLPCDNLKSGSGWLSVGIYKSIKCENKTDDIAEVVAKWAELKDIVELKDWNYILDLKWIVENNNSDKEQTESEKIQSINSMKSMWLEMNYTIVFPSKIIDANVWNYTWDTINFNIYDITDTKDPYVIFENNWDIKFTITNTEENHSLVIQKKALLYKKLILSKRELENTYKWRKDIQKFDEYIPLMKDDKLIDIYNKLEKVDLNSYKFREYKDLLNYLYAKIWIEIYNRNSIIKWTTDEWNNNKIERDNKRINNITSLKSSAEMMFMDKWRYPNNLEELVDYSFIDLSDTKNWTELNWCILWKYEYKLTDSYSYTISTCLELKNDWNYIYTSWN